VSLLCIIASIFLNEHGSGKLLIFAWLKLGASSCNRGVLVIIDWLMLLHELESGRLTVCEDIVKVLMCWGISICLGISARKIVLNRSFLSIGHHHLIFCLHMSFTFYAWDNGHAMSLYGVQQSLSMTIRKVACNHLIPSLMMRGHMSYLESTCGTDNVGKLCLVRIKVEFRIAVESDGIQAVIIKSNWLLVFLEWNGIQMAHLIQGDSYLNGSWSICDSHGFQMVWLTVLASSVKGCLKCPQARFMSTNIMEYDQTSWRDHWWP